MVNQINKLWGGIDGRVYGKFEAEEYERLKCIPFREPLGNSLTLTEINKFGLSVKYSFALQGLYWVFSII